MKFTQSAFALESNSADPLGLAALSQGLIRQSWSKKCLYVVATPIGNLADISLRALWVLHRADYIACEDTRQTQKMLTAYGIQKKCIALHRYNEQQQAKRIVLWLQEGASVAYVSDAGTPAISDPGARLVTIVRKAGLQVVPLPGASAVTTLLSAAGVTSTAKDKVGFRFLGFLPGKAKARALVLSQLQSETQPVVFFEAPHRIAALAQDLHFLGDRMLTVGRELTKQFEEVEPLVCCAFTDWLQAHPDRQKGEFSLVLHPAPRHEETTKTDLSLLKDLIDAGVGIKAAVQISAKHLKITRNALYEAALALQQTKQMYTKI